jgi:hypothetical protein
MVLGDERIRSVQSNIISGNVQGNVFPVVPENMGHVSHWAKKRCQGGQRYQALITRILITLSWIPLNCFVHERIKVKVTPEQFTKSQGVWLTPRPGRFTPAKKNRYSSDRRLDGPQGRPGRVWKISPPPGFDPQTV